MSSLPELWTEHQRTSFPPSALGMSLDGLPLVKLDARLGALLTASLRTDGVPRALPPAKVDDLRQALGLAARVVAELPLDPPTRAYFARLLTLGDTIQTL